MTQQPTPSFLAANPRYVLGDDGTSIYLCDGDRPISVMISNLSTNHAEMVVMHLNLAIQLGAMVGLREAGDTISEKIGGTD